MAQGKQQPKFERNARIRLGTEIIATHTGDIGRQVNFDFMSSADIVKQS